MKTEHHSLYHTGCQKEGRFPHLPLSCDALRLLQQIHGNAGGRREWSRELQGWDPGVAGIVFLLSQGNSCPNELTHVLVLEVLQ